MASLLKIVGGVDRVVALSSMSLALGLWKESTEDIEDIVEISQRNIDELFRPLKLG